MSINWIVLLVSTSLLIIAITLTYKFKTLLMHSMLAKLGIHSREESYSIGSSLSVVTTGSPASNSRNNFLIDRMFVPFYWRPKASRYWLVLQVPMLVNVFSTSSSLYLFTLKRDKRVLRKTFFEWTQLKTEVQLTSPLWSKDWVPFVLLWTVILVSIILVTINHMIWVFLGWIKFKSFL